MKRTRTILLAAALLNLAWFSNAQTGGYEFNDSHFHLTNYIQNGTDIHTFLAMMGNKVGRVALFGIPLQQLWSYRVRETMHPLITLMPTRLFTITPLPTHRSRWPIAR